MSQSPPNPGNAKPPPPRNSGNPLVQLWQQTQPVLKSTTARSLRGTIWLLQQALSRVEADLPETPEGGGAIAARPDLATNRPTPTTQPSLLEQLKPVFRQIGRAWVWLIKTVRSILPLPQRENLSDTAISGIIVATLLLLLGINSVLRPTKAPPQVAARPAIEQPIEQPAPVPIPETLPAPIEPTPAPKGGEAIEPEPIAPSIDSEPTPAPEGGEAIEPPAIVEPEPIEPPVAIELEPIEPPTVSEPEPEGEPPVAIEPVPSPEAVSPAIEPEPEVKPAPPPPQLTPEQALVAAIQEQVAGINQQYADGLIANIQANFRSSRLTVKIEDAWYDLSQSRQNQLAAEMLDRARALKFAHLEIVDLQGTLVARSPLVGSEMIILRRST